MAGKVKFHRVLLTGATGNLGWKIFHHTQNYRIRKLFCLSRLNSQDFKNKIENNYKHEYKKNRTLVPLKVIVGDISMPFMGMAFEIYEALRQCVDTVIHSAAETS